ncbi:MAG: hypothetical protein F4230_10740 [Holophagales bacterium]|nr:hypothetical protein [Holophagales bacterium]MYF05418.1 hypothetical protein [Holophagales bacterium]
MQSLRRSQRRWAVSRCLLAVPLVAVSACGNQAEELSDVVLARHVHTDLYDAYPGIPSPAADRVVFADFAAGARSLTVYDVATGVGRLLTTTPAERFRVTWSPDGSRVVYVDRRAEHHGVWTLDPATGQESRIVDPGDARVDHPRLLPDGTVTALRHAGDDTAWVAYAPGLDDTTVLVESAEGWAAPVRSPDGRSVAFLQVAGGYRADLAVSEIATGETRPLAADFRFGWDSRVEWSPTGDALYLAAAGPDDSLLVGWRVPLDGSPAERLTHDDHDVLAVTPLADGRVALSVYHTRTAVGLVPVTGGEPTDATTSGSTSAFLPSWRPDGGALAFSSHGPPSEGNPGSVYTVAVDPATGLAAADPFRVPLEGFQGYAMGARFSPDGERLAFYGRSFEDGRVTVYTVPAAGGTPTAVLSFVNGEPYSAPEWSADGAALFYSRNDGFGPFQVWRVDISTGATEQVTTGVLGALQPSVSPDGRTLAVTMRNAAIEVVVLAAGSAGANPDPNQERR